LKIFKYFVFVYILLFGLSIRVNALACDSEDIARFKVMASDIEINYVYNEDVYDSYGMREYDTYRVVISNIGDGLYLIEEKTNTDLRNYKISNGQIVIDKMYSGKKNFKIYSSQCNKFIKNIYITLPKFNYYSTEPICDGKDELNVCQKFYDTSDLEYSEFYNIIVNYENVDDNENIKDNKDNKEKKIDINKYIEFVKDNYIYFGIGLGVFVVLVIILLILTHKKRGVLE